MSILCDNTTPIAGKAGQTLTNDSALFDNIIDLSSLILKSDPLSDSSLNRNSIVQLTNGLNGLLGASDLTGFDTLKERFNQFPLTFTEIAAFALDESQDVDGLLDNLNNFQSGNGGGTLGSYVGYGSGSGDNGSGSGNTFQDASIGSLLGDLDFYFNLNLGASISAGACGEFANALLQLLGVFQLLDSLNTTLNMIKDLAPGIQGLQLLL